MSNLISIVPLCVLLLLYLWFLIAIWRGLSLIPSDVSHDQPYVSVILPTRNEVNNVETSLRALALQTYARTRYEVIVVDDHSDDNTVIQAKQIAEKSSGCVLKVVQTSETSGKAAAISRGALEARGEIILCTDADCSVPPRWIESMVKCLAPSVVFVAGPVFEQSAPSLLSRVEALEYLSLTTTAAGLIGAGAPIICSGASIAFRKSAFLEVDGYGNQGSSCDDETLMHRIIYRNIGKVVFNSDPGSAVLTMTPATITDFWKQRTRWASKKKRYEDSTILIRLILLYAFYLVLLVTGILAIKDPFLRLPVIATLLTKFVCEWIVLRKGAKIYRRNFQMTEFVIAELFHVPYIVVAGLVGQLNSLRWKDRKLVR